MKLLIAEDEIRAREGLRQLIPPAFTQVRACGNGQDALAAALELQPDVALCDVRMPKMNGIELARRLRLRFPDIHILFISAYSDKEYLKSAISLQADGYLEKPIDERELLDYLNRVASQIQNQQRIERRRSDLANLFARQQVLHALLRRDDTLEDALALDRRALTDRVMSAGRYLPVSVRMQWPGNNALIQYGFFSELKLAELLRGICEDFLFATLSERQLGLLFYGATAPAPSDCRRQLQPVLDMIRAANPQVINVCACVGAPCDTPEALYGNYRAAHLQAQWMGFAGDSSCALAPRPGEAAPPEDRSARFEALLSEHRLDEAKQLVRAQTDEIVRRGTGNIGQVRQYYALLLSACLRVNGVERAMPRGTRAGVELMEAFSRLGTLAELSRFICARVDDVAPAPAPVADDTGLIGSAQAFIRQNLSNPALSVQAVAESVGLSENYLNALYKRETGQTLHRAIVDLRMDRAKHLLLNRHRVPEVAQRCGFSSTGYFHAAFKKHTGLSPAAFVAQHRGRPEGGGPGDGD